MRLSFSCCHFTYRHTFSSSRPTVLKQYPFAQKCLPQYRFFNSRCLSKILMAHFPFKNPTVSETKNFGGMETTICTWSSWTFISKTSNFFHSHNCLKISSTDCCKAPFKILKRYLGHQIKWYLHCHMACANLLNALIEYLLVQFFGPPTRRIRRYSISVTTKLSA